MGFLHRIIPGGSDKSYGVYVARLAGLPGSVVIRAEELLAEHEAGKRPSRRAKSKNSLPGAPAQGMLLFADQPAEGSEVIDALRELDVDGLTPRQALDTLADLRDRLDRGTGP